jgi:hypothetical protein
MVGKRLYNLILNLNVSERKIFFIAEKNNEDKRFKYLILLLKKKDLSKIEFLEAINFIENALTPSQKSSKIKNDNVRRFVDYAIKEIEDLKIKLFVKENDIIRNYLLCQIYDSSQTVESHQTYLEKLNVSMKDGDEYFYKSFYYSKLSNLKLRSQTLKDLKVWRELVLVQKKLMQDHYSFEMSLFFDKISSSFIDDKSSVSNIDKSLIDKKTINSYIQTTDDPRIQARIFLALARFNFEEKNSFFSYTTKGLKLLENYNDRDSVLTKRKIYFASFLHYFHSGYDYSLMISSISEVLSIDKKFDIEDSKSYFYLFLLQILNDDKKGHLNYFSITGIRAYFNLESSSYLLDFLVALEYFKTGDYRKAKRGFNNLSLVNNAYLSTWSRLLEMIINYNQGNYELVEAILTSEIKRVLQNKDRIFTTNSNAYVLKYISKRMKLKYNSELDKFVISSQSLSPIHKFMVNEIAK